MFAYTCVHVPSAPRCKLCGGKCVFCVVFGKIWTGTWPANVWKCLECQLFVLAFGMWVNGTKDFLKQTTSKYWHQADCLVYNLNFSMAHFLLQHASSDSPLAYIFLIFKKTWLRFVSILQKRSTALRVFIWNALSSSVIVCLCGCLGVHLCACANFFIFA